MAHDEVPGILPPYDRQVSVWNGGHEYKQHDLVPDVGMAKTYSVLLNAPEGSHPRFLTVMDNRITNLMAHQPVYDASVFDRWGKYLGRGGGELELPGPSGVEPVSMVELATRPRLAVVTTERALTPPEPPSEGAASRHHSFWLREDLKIKLELPVDLTDEEAERVAVFVTTLPLAARKEG
jgi:hypothetical protein